MRRYNMSCGCSCGRVINTSLSIFSLLRYVSSEVNISCGWVGTQHHQLTTTQHTQSRYHTWCQFYPKLYRTMLALYMYMGHYSGLVNIISPTHSPELSLISSTSPAQQTEDLQKHCHTSHTCTCTIHTHMLYSVMYTACWSSDPLLIANKSTSMGECTAQQAPDELTHQC